MDVAISGDRTCSVTERFAPATYLFAVANGFGSVDGYPPARSALQRLRAECERRARAGRFDCGRWRPEAIAAALAGAMARVNGDLYYRSASHEDYVTGGCSLTACLIAGGRAYFAHAGTTAAYLARGDDIVALTAGDAFDADSDAGRPVLTRAIGAQPQLDVAVRSVMLGDGDAVALSGRRMRTAEERRRLTEYLRHDAQTGEASHENLLIVRYAAEETQAFEQPRPRTPFERIALAALSAALLFYVLLCLG